MPKRQPTKKAKVPIISNAVYTRVDAKDALECSLPTLHRLIKAGLLHARRSGGRTVFLGSDLLAHLAVKENQAA